MASATETKTISTEVVIGKSFIEFEEITIEKELGEGSYGKVFLGKWNGSPVALKFCRTKEKTEDFKKELKLMR
jgi:predicted Ser/Thr protein kinase